MPLPFLTGRRRTPSKRSGKEDPFLEFRSELDARTTGTPTPSGPRFFQERSAINPVVAFALGVAGVVTAVVAYYQLVQVLARGRSAPVAAVVPAPEPTLVLTPLAPAVPIPSSTPAPRLLSPPAPPTPPGWVVLDADIELQVFEGTRRIGTSKNTRLELSAGSHLLTLINDVFEIRQTIPIAVASNSTLERPIALPVGSISLSALPWAEASIDGVPVGMTPLANLPLPIGVHEIVWTNPDLGERRQQVVAKAKTPLHVGVDFSK